MALTDTAAKNTGHSGKPAGDKLHDTGGLYLLVKTAGRYWRMDYRFAGKRKTLALARPGQAPVFKSWQPTQPVQIGHSRLPCQAVSLHTSPVKPYSTPLSAAPVPHVPQTACACRLLPLRGARFAR